VSQLTTPTSPLAALRHALMVAVAVVALGTAFSTSLESQRTVKQLAERSASAPDASAPETDAMTPSLVASAGVRPCTDPIEGD
jgi:hypothetical protein